MSRHFLKGVYAPRHPEKYVGNTSNVIYRSSWERRFMVYCDQTPGVLQWASEEFHIPYVSPVDGRFHRYFPDFWLVKQGSTGKQTLVIEIKPESQTKVRATKRKTKNYLAEMATVAVNQAKWQAAEAYCKERNWQFVVLTEKHLFKGI